MSLLLALTVSAPTPTPTPSESYAGGYFPEYVKRKRSVREERERLGIIPKTVKKIVKEIVKLEREERIGEEVALEILKAELERRNIVEQERFRIYLEQQRDLFVSNEIGRFLAIQRKKDEDEENFIVDLLLM